MGERALTARTRAVRRTSYLRQSQTPVDRAGADSEGSSALITLSPRPTTEERVRGLQAAYLVALLTVIAALLAAGTAETALAVVAMAGAGAFVPL
jgi:hypothetical protein